MSQDDFFAGLDEAKARLSPRETPTGLGSRAPESAWRVLCNISTLLNAPYQRFDEVLETILEAAVDITGAERGLLMLVNDEDRLEVKLARNMNISGLADEERRISQSVVDETLRREEGVFIPNVEDLGALPEMASLASLEIHSVMCVPLKVTLRGEREGRSGASRKILGVLYVDSRAVSSGFTPSALELLQALANNATAAILNAQLHDAATRDGPTGLLTRRSFERRLSDEVKLARRQNKPLTLVVFDIDDMRSLNSTYGYKEGDRVLARAAEALRERCREIDILGRYGGNKFSLLQPHTSLDAALQAAEKLRRGIAETNFFPDQALARRVTVSVGVAGYERGLDSFALIQRADKALYKSKEEGHNRVSVYQTGLAETARRTDRLAGVFSGDPARDYRNVLMLLETIEEINKRQRLEDLLPLVVDVIIDLAEAERGLLMLTNGNGEAAVTVSRNQAKKDIDNLDYSHSVVKRVLDHDQPVREAFARDSAPISQSIGKLDIQAILCVPLTIHGPGERQKRTLGVLYVDRRERGGEFDEASLAFFDTLARQIAVAIENASLYQRNEALRQQLALQLDRTKEELNTVRIELVEKEKEIAHKYNYDQIIGRSQRMVELFRLLDRIVDTNVPVFVHGESGTGKELVAKAIHYNGPRRAERLVSENCAAIGESLLESELFGYVKGSFTGALQDRKGLFEVATGGSLFLDEVGDMSMTMQKKLLRVLEVGEIRRVGGKETIKVDVRIISASNRDLKKLVEEGLFREDLYYRLNVVKVSLPTLRERKEDIPLLAEHFLNSIDFDGTRRNFSREAMQKLLSHDWPGNVRELKNVIERTKIVCDGEIVRGQDIRLDSSFGPLPSSPLSSYMTPSSLPMSSGPIELPDSAAADARFQEFNERQRMLIAIMRQHGIVKNREYYELTKVSKSTGWRDLKELIDRGIVLVQGKGKGSTYSLAAEYSKS
jgi:Nif-specific regulatory protein